MGGQISTENLEQRTKRMLKVIPLTHSLPATEICPRYCGLVLHRRLQTGRQITPSQLKDET